MDLILLWSNVLVFKLSRFCFNCISSLIDQQYAQKSSSLIITLSHGHKAGALKVCPYELIWPMHCQAALKCNPVFSHCQDLSIVTKILLHYGFF